MNSSTPVSPRKVQYFLTHHPLYGPLESVPLYGAYEGGRSSKLQLFSLQIVQSSGAFETIDVGYNINPKIRYKFNIITR